jgi:hypothetical protein
MMKKKIAVVGAVVCGLVGMSSAFAQEMTVWTVGCGDNKNTRTIRVTARDRSEAREMVMREVQSSGFCNPHRMTTLGVQAVGR